MSKKLIIILVIIGCISLGTINFLRQTEGVYHKSYSPDGQYSCYASVYKYLNLNVPFTKFGDKSGKVTVYDEIEKKIVGSSSIDMIFNINDMDWNEESLTQRGHFSIQLPRKININLINKHQESIPVNNTWNLNLQDKQYAVNKKGNRLTVRNENSEIIFKDIHYISQINNDSVQVLNENTEIEYYNTQLKKATENLKNEPHFYGVCGNVSTYNLKIEENDQYYIIKKAVGFTSYDFDNYTTIDSIHKTTIKDIYFLNNKRKLTHDENFRNLEYVMIDYGSYFGILEEKYGIQYFDKIDSTTWPIKVMRNKLHGYYNITAVKYLELHAYEFNLAEFKDVNNKKGYVDLIGNEYYK